MRKRDRTTEERDFDVKLKRGLMRLGENPNPSSSERNGFEVTKPHQPTRTYPHVLVWDRLGRKGQRCKVLRVTGNLYRTQVEFEDGFVAVVERMAIRRSE
jgi:hypothetical protein